MASWRCLTCRTVYAVGIPSCPHCSSADYEEDGVAKANAEGAATHYVGEGDPVPDDLPPGVTGEGKQKRLEIGDVVEHVMARNHVGDRDRLCHAWPTAGDASGYEAACLRPFREQCEHSFVDVDSRELGRPGE